MYYARVLYKQIAYYMDIAIRMNFKHENSCLFKYINLHIIFY